MNKPGLLLFWIWCCLVACQQEQKVMHQPQWVPIFNGFDLNNWEVKIKGYPLGYDFGNTFRVNDQMIQIRFDKYQTFNSRYGYLIHRSPYSHYRLRAEYRFVGEQAKVAAPWARKNSGITIHGQPPATVGLDQNFMIGLEMQLLGRIDGERRPTGNLCTPGTIVDINKRPFLWDCTTFDGPTIKDSTWVTVELLVLGDSLVEHRVNSQSILQYTHPRMGDGMVYGYDPAYHQKGKPLKSGYISIQSASHPVDFRKIEVMRLDIGENENK